ncbi:sensor histidine kinase [Peptostreptococcus equinus]|uniref:histidine kinase n=1 Tax=Peptostreptococcus equinus TaxID=3003601 RepID=A0ABY7JSI6_9FIRM|nr:histidine kinase [Peptostreptococcus sp. CBA3647]WAW15128.1 histidine kinase [Peptostreptococcus sp. CBA3647]
MNILINNKIFKKAILIWFISITILIIYNKEAYLIIPLCLGTISAFILTCSNKKYIYILSLGIFSLSYILAFYLKNNNIYTSMHIEHIGVFTALIIYINSHRNFNKNNKKTNISIKKMINEDTSDISINKYIKQINLVYYMIFLFFSFIMTLDFILIILISLFSLFSYNIADLEIDLLFTKDKYYSYYSNSKDHEKILKNKYEDLIVKQDKKIENAILNERNRISRDIHDSLGHLTSRGILQIGALMVIEKDKQKHEQLSMLKSTLQEGMNEVRKSLHNFQNQTINLKNELDKVIIDFNFCPISFTYSLDTDLNLKSKYTIIYIIKEALTNIVKHSNADQAEISIVESFDKLYIKIFDNGSIENIDADGMGLFSIRKRVADLNGVLEISTNNGFRIFITLNKEEK